MASKEEDQHFGKAQSEPRSKVYLKSVEWLGESWAEEKAVQSDRSGTF